MLPPEHMARMHKMLLAQQGRVTWVPLHAGHMDAYETAAQVSQLLPIRPVGRALCVSVLCHRPFHSASSNCGRAFTVKASAAAMMQRLNKIRKLAKEGDGELPIRAKSCALFAG